MTGNGINVSRRVIGGPGSNWIGDTHQQSITQGSPPTLFRAVVVEVFFDPETLTDQEKRDLRATVGNPELVDIMPPNTVLVRVVSNGQDLSNSVPSLVFPLFSSHLQLPVSPGEQVFVIYDDYAHQDTTLGRWISRIHEGSPVEDCNYTHADRRFDPTLSLETQRTSTRPSSTGFVPFFPNGGGTPDTITLRPPTGSANPYDAIVGSANASKVTTPEPVPRWKKRPQELVIQGANNSLIMLGEDRTGPATRVTGSAQLDRVGYSGTVDVVCGRGRGMIPYDQSREPTADEKTRTSPLVVRNSRRKLETDKMPSRRDRRRNRNEGNPDFRRDAARLYVSMNTAGDRNFRTQHSTNPEHGFEYPADTVRPVQPREAEGGAGNSYVVAKADHVRIVGRKETNPEIKGSVLLLREGTKDQDLAYLYLEEGKAQIEAKEIYLGNATRKNEPYIKWSVYDQHITELKNQIKALADQVQRITESYDTAFRASVAVTFSGVGSLMAIGPPVRTETTSTVQSVKTAIDSIDPVAAKSAKVFGS